MNRDYVIDLGDRAVKTAAQTAVVVIGADMFNVFHADWLAIAGCSLGGGVLSLLTNLGQRGITGR